MFVMTTFHPQVWDLGQGSMRGRSSCGIRGKGQTTGRGGVQVNELVRFDVLEVAGGVYCSCWSNRCCSEPQYRTTVAKLLRQQANDERSPAMSIITTFHPQVRERGEASIGIRFSCRTEVGDRPLAGEEQVRELPRLDV